MDPHRKRIPGFKLIGGIAALLFAVAAPWLLSAYDR
jgi:hypothetical protein